MTTTTSGFDRLASSIGAFFYRFLGGPPSILAQNPTITEELRELRQEIFVDFKEGEKAQVIRDDIDTNKVAEEGIDVIVTVLGLMTAADVEETQLEYYMRAVADKLDAKTHETHAIHPVTGKITRRSQL